MNKYARNKKELCNVYESMHHISEYHQRPYTKVCNARVQYVFSKYANSKLAQNFTFLKIGEQFDHIRLQHAFYIKSGSNF